MKGAAARQERRPRLAAVRTHENEAEIPIDVIAEIVSRLPAKFIAQCTLVCKEWRSMIKNPRFSILHAKNKTFSTFYGTKKNGSLSTSYVLELYEDLRFGKINFKGKAPPPPGPRSDKSIVGVCNGLVCTLERTYRSDTISVVNPITKESLTLPIHDWRCTDGKYAPTTANYAFGYSASTDRYKVLKCVLWNSRVEYDILTVGVDESWRKLSKDHYSFPNNENRRPMVHLNGAFCWLVSGDNDQLLCILRLDIAEEKTHQMQLPRGLPLDDNNCSILRALLIVLYNRLCLHIEVQSDDQRVPSDTIWEMEVYGDGNSWTRNGALNRFIAEVPHSVYPLITTQDGRLLLRYGQSCGLHSCSREGMKCKEIKLRHFVKSLYDVTPTFSPIDEVIKRAV